MMSEVMGNFSELPGDVLSVIARKLLTLSDLVRFGGVCISWRLASLANPKHCKLLSLLPVLLLPSPSTDDEQEEDHDHNQQTDDDDEVDVCICQLHPTDDEEEDVDDDDVDDEDNEDEDQQIDDDDEDEDDEDNEDEDKEDEDQQIDDDDDDDDEDEDEDEDDDKEDEDQQIDDDEENEDEDKQIDDDDNKDEDKQTDEDEDTDEKNKTNTITRSLYSLYDGKVHDVELRVGGDCRSSSHGWLVVTTEADQNYSVRLLNPFISVNNVIELPPLTTFQLSSHGGTEVRYSNYLIKAVISASPSSCSNPKDIVVLAIHGCYTLSFCRPGDKAWTALPNKWGQVFQDIIYYNGLFYGIIQSGSVFAIEIDPLHAKLKVFKELIRVPLNHAGRKYIVESSGELLQVWRKIDHSRLFKYKTVCVDIFKLDQTGSNSKWVKIKTLNGRMLFLGHNASISFLASDFPGCKPNCIYFTDDNEEVFLSESSSRGPHDIGIYNLEDGSFEPHYRMHTKEITPHPIWIQPTL